jgi:hypothetical protein
MLQKRSEDHYYFCRHDSLLGLSWLPGLRLLLGRRALPDTATITSCRHCEHRGQALAICVVVAGRGHIRLRRTSGASSRGGRTRKRLQVRRSAAVSCGAATATGFKFDGILLARAVAQHVEQRRRGPAQSCVASGSLTGGFELTVLNSLWEGSYFINQTENLSRSFLTSRCGAEIFYS